MATVVNKWYNTAATIDTGARLLLASERYGFAIDATAYGTAAYTGGPVGGTVAIKADNVTDKPNIPMDAAAGLLKGASPLVNSGTSPKMVHNEASPYVRWSAHNILIRSQEFDNAEWSGNFITVTANDAVAPDETTTADKFVESDTSAANYRCSAKTVVAGFSHTTNIYIKPSNITWLQVAVTDNTSFSNGSVVYFDVVNGTVGTTNNAAAGTGYGVTDATITSAGNGWYRLSITSENSHTGFVLWVNSATADNSATRVTSGTYWVWGAQLNRGTIATPYLATTSAARIGIPLSYDAAEAQYGILVEPAATNLLTQSEDLTTWTVNNITITSQDTTAPDGTTTADLATLTSSSSPSCRRTNGALSDAVYTISCYFKKSVGDYVNIQLSDFSANSFGGWFNINAGTVGSTSTFGAGTVTSTSITSVGNGWYRCVVTGDTGAAATFYTAFYFAQAEGGGVNGDAGYAWGAQTETGLVATSYIPTLGSTVTRANDGVYALLSNTPYSLTVGTAYLDSRNRKAFVEDTSFDPVALGFSTSGAGYNGQEIGGGSTSQTFRFLAITSGNAQADINFAWTASTRGQGSSAWAANDFAASFDGSAITTDVAGTVASDPTEMRLGWINTTSQGRWSGYIYRIVQVPRRVIDGDLPDWRYIA
jgi:hypothetical protein